LATKTYRAACERWPGASITLRQGARVIERSRQTRPVGRGADAARKGARRAVRNGHRRQAARLPRDRREVAIEAAEHLKRKLVVKA
jgi:hypothetical protein